MASVLGVQVLIGGEAHAGERCVVEGEETRGMEEQGSCPMIRVEISWTSRISIEG